MREGCDAFLDGWEQELEQVLINRTSDDDYTVYQLCTEISKVYIYSNNTNINIFIYT